MYAVCSIIEQMMNTHAGSWPIALRELGRDRVRRAGVREERLRATADLRGIINLTSWRGHSGRRYVVGIHPLTEPELREVSEAVLIAVQRDEEGVGQVVEVVCVGPRLREAARRSFIERTRQQGATELHVHRLAESAGQRQSVVEDLKVPIA